MSQHKRLVWIFEIPIDKNQSKGKHVGFLFLVERNYERLKSFESQRS